MASIHKDPRSRFWQAAWRDANGRLTIRSTRLEASPEHPDPKQRTTLAGENKRLAMEMAIRFETAAKGNAVESQLRSIVSDISAKVNRERIEFARCDVFLRDWITRCEKSKSGTTVTRYRGTVEDFLASLGAKASATLGDITPRDVEAYTETRLANGRNPSTVKIDLKTLNTPFALALRQGIILSNPVAAAEEVKGEKETREPFSFAEIKSLIKAAKGEWKTAILLGAFSGLRLGDCTRLTWANVDLTEKVLKVRPSKTRKKKRDLVIAIHRTLEKHLMDLAGSCDDPTAPLCPRLSKSKPGGRSGLSRQFQEIMRAAGLEQTTIAAGGSAGRAFNKRTFHSLRHSFISALEEAGIAPDLRKKLAGHSDDKSHAGYTHTQLKTLASAVNALPEL